MRDACTAAALQDKSCDAPSRTLCLYDESFASKSKLIDKTSALQSLDAIIGSAPSCPTATRRSARRSQTVDSLRRALAAVADFFRARAARLQAAGLKRAEGALERRLARAPPIRRRRNPETVPHTGAPPIRRRRDPQNDDVGHGQPVGQGGRRRAAARLAAAARERAHPADGPTTRLGPTEGRRARARDVAATARGPDAAESGSAHGRRPIINE